MTPMLPTSPAAILNPLQLDQLRQQLIGYLQSQNDPVTNWIDGGRRRTQMEYYARAANDLLANLFPTLAGASFLDLALQLPSAADPDGWVDLIAEQIFSLTRTAAVLTLQSVLFASDGTFGPFSIDSSTVVRSPLTGNRYYAITTGTLISGSPSSVLVTMRAEAPNDPALGILYADGPNTLTEFVNPWRGVTVTNAPPFFSAVTTTPSPALGLGVVTVSGTPPALATAYDFQIEGDGQNTTAVFRWRQNGGPWSAPATLVASFAIPATSVTVNFANDGGGSNPSFRAGDVYSFTAPGTPITTPGTPRETSAALAQRCLDRLPDLFAIPQDKRIGWAKAASGLVVRVKVLPDATYPGRMLVTIAGAPGTATLSGGVVSAVQAALDTRESAGRIDLVQAATATTVTATNGSSGSVIAPAAKLTQVRAAANLAFASYVNGTDVGGVVRLAKVVEILMDAGATDVIGLLLNGVATNVVLGSAAVAVAADLGSLTWVEGSDVGSYGDFMTKQLPGGFQRTDFIASLQAAGNLLDAQEEILRQAILAGFPTKGALDDINFPTNPQYALAPSDALDAVGGDCGLPRAAAESPADNGGVKDQAYAARLLGAWEQWKYGGAHYGILRALSLAGYSSMVIVQQNGRNSRLTGSGGTVADMTLGSLMTCLDRRNPWTSIPPGWTFDHGPRAYWAKLGIVFTADASLLHSNGDGSVSPGQAALRNIVDGWKAAEMVFDGAYVILAGRLLGWPTGRTMGTDPNLGSNSVRVIPGDGSRAFVEGP